MRLNCNINGSQYSLVVNSDKPLSEILKEQIITFADNSCETEGERFSCFIYTQQQMISLYCAVT